MCWHRRCQTLMYAERRANQACIVTYPFARDHVRMNGRACSGHGTVAADLVRPLSHSQYDIPPCAINAPDGIVIAALCYDDVHHRVGDASHIRMADGQNLYDKCQTPGVRQPVGPRSVSARMEGVSIMPPAAFAPVCADNRSLNTSRVRGLAMASEPGWLAPLACRKRPSPVMVARS
jgi:hypothetical protein